MDNPESSPPVSPCKYITRNRAGHTSLKITGELGGRKTTNQEQRQAETLQGRLWDGFKWTQITAENTSVDFLLCLYCPVKVIRHQTVNGLMFWVDWEGNTNLC